MTAHRLQRCAGLLTSQAKRFFSAIAKKTGMKIDMPMSMYYDYRFHAVMKTTA